MAPASRLAGVSKDTKGSCGPHDRTIVIAVVDSAERLAELAPVVEAIMDTGMTAISDVQVVRVQKKTAVT